MATYVAFTAAATTPALPAGTTTGDWVVVFAGRDANATPPTLPAGWTQIITRAAANAIMVAYRLKDASWSTIPAFTNATRATAVTVRPASGKELAVGVNAVQGATSTSVAWAVQTLQVNDGTSVILRYFAHTRPDATPGTPANHTIIEATGTRPGFGTYRKTATTDMAAATLSVSRSDVWSSAQVEIKDIIPVAITQAAYGFYADGTETGSTALASQDTAPTIDVTQGDVNVQLRVRLQSTSVTSGSPLDDYQLQWQQNAGTWMNVIPTFTGLEAYNSPNLTEAALTTNRLTGGTGGFAVGYVSEDGLNDNFQMFANKYTELLYSLKLKSSGLSNNDTLTFRILRNGVTTTMTYSSTPTINVTKTLPAVTQAGYRFFDQGSESGSNPLGDENTPITGNLTTGDGIGSLRVLLQSTTAAPLPATDDWQLQFKKGDESLTLVDSYSDVNFSTGTQLDANFPQVGQSFLGNGQALKRVGFYLARSVSATGILSAALYSHVDVFGSGGKPATGLTGSTNLVEVASVSTSSYGWVYFDFDGTFTLANGTPYYINVEIQTTVVGACNVGADVSSPTHPGNLAILTAGVGWTSYTGQDVIFELYTGSTWTNVALPIVDQYEYVATAETSFQSGSSLYHGQSFTGNGKKLSRVNFWMRRVGTPPEDTFTVSLYSHTGTFGSTGTPSAILTTSGPRVASSFSTTYGWESFDFDGSYVLQNGVKYFVVVSTPSTTATVSNSIKLNYHQSTPTHSGNAVTSFDGTAWSTTVNDRYFQVISLGEEIFPYDDPSLTDGQATTNRLTGTGSFTPGKVSEDGLVDNLGFPGNNFTELLYPVQIKQTEFVQGDTIYFRVLRNGSPITTTQTPLINVVSSYVPPNTGGADVTHDWTISAAGTAPVSEPPNSGSATANWSTNATAVGEAPIITTANTGTAVVNWSVAIGGQTLSPIWTGPTSLTSGGSDVGPYELGLEFTMYNPQTLGGVRIYMPAANGTTNRNLHLWNGITQALLATWDIPEDLLTGWNEYLIPAGQEYLLTTGVTYILSFNTAGNPCYGYRLNELSSPQHMGEFSLDRSRYGTTMNAFPGTNPSAAWYGIDPMVLTAGGAVGERTPKASATASWTETVTAAGVKPVVPPKTGSATATWTETITATGVKPVVGVKQGTATATWSEAISAQGKKSPIATSTASWTETITATGKRTPRATATALYLETITATGTKAPKATATATWTEALTAAGKKSPRATSTTSYLETISVTSKRNPIATSTANHSWTSIAQGVKPVVGVKQGSAIASWATTGTATGKRTPKATATTAYSENVTATGSKLQRGTAIVSWSEAISAQGKRSPIATGTTQYTENPGAVGKRTPKAVSTANHSWTSIAQGFKPVVGQKQGSAIAVWSETITATGKRAPIATSTTLYSENVTAAGKKLQKSTVTTTWTNAITAQGKKLQKATSTTAYLFTGSAVGKKTPKAVTTANHSWVSIAQGVRPVVGQKQGTAIVSWAETSTAVGKRFPKATATVSYFETVTVNGKKFLRGTATVAWTETISAAGKKVLRGSSTVLWSESITVSGKRIPKAFGAVFHSWDLLVDGKYYPKAMSTVEILWQLSATGVDERGIVILNDADSIFLGNLEVKAVYVGSNKVWEML